MNSLTDFVIDSKQASLYDEKVLGGKAKNMFWLSANGFNVPSWLVVTTFAFKEQLENGGSKELILSTMENLPEDNTEKAAQLKTLRNEIEKTTLLYIT